jgi:predicted Zn-dependent peptidase
LAAYETLNGGWQTMFDQVAQIESVTREDVQAMAQKYLTRGNATVGYMITEDKDDEMASE